MNDEKPINDSELPEPGGNGNDHEQEKPVYNPFLKAPEVSPEGEDFNITAGFTRRRPGQFGEQIIMEVIRKRDAKTFDFAIGVGSQNHRLLARRMGHEGMWRGVINLKRVKGANRDIVAVNDQSGIPF